MHDRGTGQRYIRHRDHGTFYGDIVDEDNSSGGRGDP